MIVKEYMLSKEELKRDFPIGSKHIIDGKEVVVTEIHDPMTANCMASYPMVFFEEVASIQNYETNHTCNCQHNSNLRDNEPCCRCDSRKTNAEIVKVDSLEIIVRMIGNKPYYEVKYREVGKKDYSVGYSSYDLKIVLGFIAEYFEIVESDRKEGLITDVTMEITSSKFTTTNADRIRNMSDEELTELITGSLNFDCADYCDSFTNGCAFKCGKKEKEIALKWLQSEAE